jgi:hypothetical protein
LLFERPRPGWSEEVTALAAEVEDADLREAAVASRAAREEEYLAVLGPGAPVSPREVAYRGLADPGQTLAEISAYHQAFAFQPEREDPIDHVAVEASLAGYLLLKEAYARARGDVEAAQTAASAFARFVTEHLRWMAAPLAERLEPCDVIPHLALAARALLARTGAPPQATIPGPGPGIVADSFECGGCGVPPAGPSA